MTRPGPALRVAVVAAGLAAGLAALGLAAPARADTLQVDLQVNPERNFQVVQELSYEAIVHGNDGDRADLRLRVALHNASSREQDAVLSLALPRDAEIHGLQIAQGGVWGAGKAAGIAAEPGRRDPGSVLVRPLAPVSAGELPGAEIVVFSLEPGATTQVELQLKVPLRLRGERWELELPGRGDERSGLAGDRRVLVKAPRFWVDHTSNAGEPFLVTAPEDHVVVSWPVEQGARPGAAAPLDAHLAALPDGPGARSGRFTLSLRLGPGAPVKPDHVVLVVDRSRSTAPAMHREAFTAVAALFDALPPGLTFDALSFARRARPLLAEASGWPEVHDLAARERVAAALDAGAREQGTDLAAALALAGQRIVARGARRPLVLVITDGMVPPGADAATIARVFADSLGKRSEVRPELLFLIEEPLLARRGIAPEHPIARIAAGLGARISLASLAQHGGDGGEALARTMLSAPRVLRDLQVTLPRHAALADPVPAGLVAGNVVVLGGRYTGAAPTLRVRGRQGEQRVEQRPRAQTRPTPPAALVASLRPGGPTQAASEGFAVPPWYGRRYQRSARLDLSWAGRGRVDERGRLDEKIFRRYLGTRVFPRARACYNLALGRNQSLGGRVLFAFEVGKGEVMLATTDAAGMSQRDPLFESCLLEAAWMLDIPAGKLDEQIYRVRYPLVFNPPRTGRPSLADDPSDASTVEMLLGPRG